VVLVDEREVPQQWTEVTRSIKMSILCLRASEEREHDVWSDGEGRGATRRIGCRRPSQTATMIRMG
jgi:hypothetical protein